MGVAPASLGEAAVPQAPSAILAVEDLSKRFEMPEEGPADPVTGAVTSADTARIALSIADTASTALSVMTSSLSSCPLTRSIVPPVLLITGSTSRSVFLTVRRSCESRTPSFQNA